MQTEVHACYSSMFAEVESDSMTLLDANIGVSFRGPGHT